jgi:hypothetical protein
MLGGEMGQPPTGSGLSGQFTVEVERLHAFVEAIEGDGVAFVGSMTDVMNAMANLPVNFMGGGLIEGRGFGDIYFPCFDALMAFQSEVIGGLGTLAGGAAMASLAYVDGDASSSEAVAAVTDAFAPPPPAPSPSPEDLRRWFAAARDGEEAAQQQWDENVEAFDEEVAQQRDVVAGRDGSPDGENAEPFSSDYYDDSGYPHRETVGSGGAFIAVANDDEHVSDVELPDLGDDAPGSNAISDRELGSLPSWEFPDEVQDELQRVGPVPPEPHG